jgi:predicted amino acid-binding ACT domain protein
MSAEKQTRYVVSVVVPDRVAILRDITTAITDMDANIDGISQTVVAGYFTALLTATFEDRPSADAVKAAIQDRFDNRSASIHVRSHDAPPASRRRVKGDRYVVIVTGVDRKGVLRAVTTFLAEHGINIEDWHVSFDPPRVTHVGEITVPAALDVKQLQDGFHDVLAALGLNGCVQHQNIFRVTNEVGAIKLLLREKPHASND